MLEQREIFVAQVSVTLNAQSFLGEGAYRLQQPGEVVDRPTTG
jgi:hypothetical protein